MRIRIGSHLVAPRQGYTHHGIYIGRGKVIHYSGFAEGLSTGPIELTTLEAFRNERELWARRYFRPRYTGEAAVRRAKSRLGEDRYNLLSNNCEHFCTWVVTGRSASQQVDMLHQFVDLLLPRDVGKQLRRAKEEDESRNSDLDLENLLYIANSTYQRAQGEMKPRPDTILGGEAITTIAAKVIPGVAPAVYALKLVKRLLK